jgi:hypothetical protein
VKATFKALISRICVGFWRGLVVSQSGGGLCCGASSWLEEGPSKLIVPFLACGDLRGFDADQSYPLPSTSGAGSEKAESAYQSLAQSSPLLNLLIGLHGTQENAVTENSLNCFQHFAMAADGPPYHADGPPVYSSEKC